MLLELNIVSIKEENIGMEVGRSVARVFVSLEHGLTYLCSRPKKWHFLLFVRNWRRCSWSTRRSWARGSRWTSTLRRSWSRRSRRWVVTTSQLDVNLACWKQDRLVFVEKVQKLPLSQGHETERKTFETKMKAEYKLKKERWKREMESQETPKSQRNQGEAQPRPCHSPFFQGLDFLCPVPQPFLLPSSSFSSFSSSVAFLSKQKLTFPSEFQPALSWHRANNKLQHTQLDLQRLVFQYATTAMASFQYGHKA